MSAHNSMLEVSLWRGDDHSGTFRTYQVPSQDSQTILDVVTWIQQNLDPNLSYRYACRVGMCGSCAMTVNGVPRWTCRTHVKKVLKADAGLEIKPLRNLPIIKDLAVDMTPFFDKWVAAEGVFHGGKSRQDPLETIDPNASQRVAASDAIECINCAVCYSACDVVAKQKAYLGPAALNRAWSLVNDQRDHAQSQRLQAVSQEGGCQNCHSQQGCARHCPNDLNPTASIAGLKRRSALRWFQREKPHA